MIYVGTVAQACFLGVVHSCTNSQHEADLLHLLLLIDWASEVSLTTFLELQQQQQQQHDANLADN